MSFLRSSFIRECLGKGRLADQPAGLGWLNGASPARNLRIRGLMALNVFPVVNGCLSDHAFRAITPCVRSRGLMALNVSSCEQSCLSDPAFRAVTPCVRL
jgi:hypothetical protein